MNINYGILAVDVRPNDEGMNSILHFCGYESLPTEDDFDDLRHELSMDEEFGLTRMMDYVILVEAPSEVVEIYRETFKD